MIQSNLDAFLQEIMPRWDIPGLAVGIVQEDEIAYAKGFGVQNLDTQAPVTLDSVFCVQSVSKCLVATAVMQLVERGLLALDAPIIHYLPYFRMDDERCQQMTIRQALSHTSGMPDIDEIEYVDWMNHPEYDEGAAERFVRGLHSRKLIADPGQRFSYSNIAYNLLGDLLAKVTGNSFEDVMKEQVLMPSEMADSTFFFPDVPLDRLAWPHLRSPGMKPNPVYPYHRADAPASFLHTTVVDLCRWAITSLKRGENHGQRILSTAGYDLMWTVVAERNDARPDIYEDIGLGWTLGHFQGHRTVSHGGAGFGGTAFLLLLPEVQSAVVVLCNQESSAHMQIVEGIADALLGGTPQAGKVSWMVPMSRALAQGGMDLAFACYDEIKTRQDEYHFGEYDLPDLSLQLFTAGNFELAVDVLNMNVHIFPEHVDSYLQQAKMYFHHGDNGRAKDSLIKAQAIEPDNPETARLLTNFL
jgi:CubicO group peptidase (beta-lactamase class C family)